MARENLKDLLIDKLKDTYDAEHQIAEALPKLINAATSADLKQAFETHLKQAEVHIARLEHAFKLLGETPTRKTCKAMTCLLAESEDLINDHNASALLDAGLIGAAQRVEHYEISAYGTSRAYAESLGQSELVDLLQQTLDEEKEADQLLSDLGLEINQESIVAVEIPGGKRN